MELRAVCKLVAAVNCQKKNVIDFFLLLPSSYSLASKAAHNEWKFAWFKLDKTNLNYCTMSVVLPHNVHTFWQRLANGLPAQVAVVCVWSLTVCAVHRTCDPRINQIYIIIYTLYYTRFGIEKRAIEARSVLTALEIYPRLHSLARKIVKK